MKKRDKIISIVSGILALLAVLAMVIAFFIHTPPKPPSVSYSTQEDADFEKAAANSSTGKSSNPDINAICDTGGFTVKYISEVKDEDGENPRWGNHKLNSTDKYVLYGGKVDYFDYSPGLWYKTKTRIYFMAHDGESGTEMSHIKKIGDNKYSAQQEDYAEGLSGNYMIEIVPFKK